MTNKSLVSVLSLMTVGILLALNFAFSANETAERQKDEIANLQGQIHALSEKQLADQESNLKDLEDNKSVEKRVSDLEVKSQNHDMDINTINLKLLKGKKK